MKKARLMHRRSDLVIWLMIFWCLPAGVQAQLLLVETGRADLGDGRSISPAYLLARGDTILYIGTERPQIQEPVTVIRQPQSRLYPGFIGCNSSVGLEEIEAVRATVDKREVGVFNPHVRSLIAYEADSEIIPTLKSNGVLLAQITPEGGRISGSSSLMALAGWNWEDAVCISDLGVHVYWPDNHIFTGWWAEVGPIEKNKQYLDEVSEIRNFLYAAEAYGKQGRPLPSNLRFEAMREVFSGKRRVFVHTQMAAGMRDAVELLGQFGIRPVIVGGRESWMIPEFLAARQIPVILRGVHNLPSRIDEAVDQPYRTPAVLHEKGVQMAISVDGSWQQRNLPFHAGHAVGYGLPYETAVAAISGSAAAILGAERYGVLKPGGSATFFISRGDALDMRTNDVTHAYIRGQAADLDDKQKALYRRFSKKYESD